MTGIASRSGPTICGLNSCAESRFAVSVPGRESAYMRPWPTMSSRTAGTGRFLPTAATCKAFANGTMTAKLRWKRRKTGGNPAADTPYARRRACPGLRPDARRVEPMARREHTRPASKKWEKLGKTVRPPPCGIFSPRGTREIWDEKTGRSLCQKQTSPAFPANCLPLL